MALPAAVTAWCLHPLLRPGYLLQVDAVFGPRGPISLGGVGAPLVLLNHLLGGALAGRIFVAGALYLCSFGPMVLLRRRIWLAQVPAGMLAALNPWVYDRLIQGQWGVAAALGILFVWLAAWEALQDQPGLRRAALCALAGWSAIVLDQHFVGMLIVLAGASMLWHRAWHNRSWLLWGAASFLILGGMLLYALPPFFLGHNSSYYTLQHVGRADLVEFRAVSGSYGLWPNLIGLYGFWPERLGRIPLLNASAPWWPVSIAALVALAVTGAVACRERTWLLLTGLIGLAIAGSTATRVGQDVFLWLMERSPLLGAYREPEKWSALWVVALVVLGAEAVGWLATRPGPRWVGELAGPAAIAMVAATLFPAGAAMLREVPATVLPVQYPSGWIRTAAYLQEHVSPRARVVVLPWSLYEVLPFTGKLLTANPASVVFPGNLISPNDIQIPGVVTEARSPRGLTQVAINPRPGSCTLQRILSLLDVHWAIVEPAPGGNAAAAALLSCGFQARSGTLPGLVLLHD
ncbi:MAG TPA: hypothetical protein VNH38_03975 [Candidatus Dormibacteraeota bacterium]|nr:hypothetical protein [Candidatus Dormibacteraeota bacterium]